jgi:hypothetical protein
MNLLQFFKKADRNPQFQVKTIRPTLSTMGYGRDRLTFDDAKRPAGRKPEGGMIVLPDSFFEGQVRATVARVFDAHAPAVEGHWAVGLFFTGRYGRSERSEPEYSSRSACVRVDSGAANILELAWRIAEAHSAQAVLVAPWKSGNFHIVSKLPS